jgi:hypothetical protein
MALGVRRVEEIMIFFGRSGNWLHEKFYFSGEERARASKHVMFAFRF